MDDIFYVLPNPTIIDIEELNTKKSEPGDYFVYATVSRPTKFEKEKISIRITLPLNPEKPPSVNGRNFIAKVINPKNIPKIFKVKGGIFLHFGEITEKVFVEEGILNFLVDKIVRIF